MLLFGKIQLRGKYPAGSDSHILVPDHTYHLFIKRNIEGCTERKR